MHGTEEHLVEIQAAEDLLRPVFESLVMNKAAQAQNDFMGKAWITVYHNHQEAPAEQQRFDDWQRDTSSDLTCRGRSPKVIKVVTRQLGAPASYGVTSSSPQVLLKYGPRGHDAMNHANSIAMVHKVDNEGRAIGFGFVAVAIRDIPPGCTLGILNGAIDVASRGHSSTKWLLRWTSQIPS